MPYFYGMLAVAGWIWLVIVFAYLFVRLRRQSRARGFDVSLSRGDEKQS